MNDIISVRNDVNDMLRIDDVTIERVNISKKELDRSLFDYEKHKNTKKTSAVSKKHSHVANQEFISNQTQNESNVNSESHLTNILQELEAFKKEGARLDLNSIQQKYIKLFRHVSVDLDQEKVSLQRSNLNKQFAAKLGLKSDQGLIKKKIAQPVFNLKELYKWQPVEEPKKAIKSSISIGEQPTLQINHKKDDFNIIPLQDELKPDDSEISNDQFVKFHRINQAYSYYYSYYYSHYMKELMFN